jgi:hypothetical protein
VPDCDPLDEECARAAATAAGWNPDDPFIDTPENRDVKAWHVYLGTARTVRAVVGVLKQHEARIEAVAAELAEVVHA